MLSLSVVRSLVLRDDAEQHVSSMAAKAAGAGSLRLSKPKQKPKKNKKKLEQSQSQSLYLPSSEQGPPCLIFVPTEEMVKSHRRLACIAREIGMEFSGDMINKRLVFCWPGGSALRESVSLPFPRLADAPPRALLQLEKLGRGFFKLRYPPLMADEHDCCASSQPQQQQKVSASGSGATGSLAVAFTGEAVADTERLRRIMTGVGWSLFKVKAVEDAAVDEEDDEENDNEILVFRKMDFKLRLQWDATLHPLPSPGFRACELRLAANMDLSNAPLEILEFLVLMTDHLFCVKPPRNHRHCSTRRMMMKF